MAYATLLQDETVESEFLAVIKPRRRDTSWTLFSGSVYSIPFTYGEVRYIEQDGVALTMASSTSLSVGQFYYDIDNATLYVRCSASEDPNTVFVVATYEITIGTIDAHWHRVPTDTSTRTVYFGAYINKSPVLKQSMSDSFFGFIPVQTTNLTINNAEHWFDYHAFDSSFNQIDIDVYHWLGKDLDEDNIKLVLGGLVNSFVLEKNTVSLTMSSRIDLLKKEFRNPEGENFYNISTFPALNPNFSGKPIRQVYGRVDNFVPVNVSYLDSETVTTSDNRNWIVCAGTVNMATQIKTVPVSPSSTITRTYVNNANGINIDDAVKINGATDYFVIVTNVNRTGAQYIEHAAIAAPADPGDTVERSFVGNIFINQNSTIFRPLFDRDYTVNLSGSGDTVGFDFVNNFEAALGMDTLTVNDQVLCRVYGRSNDITLGGPAFGSNDAEMGNIANPIQILLDLFKRNLSISESDINAASFTTALAARPYPVGFAIPQESSGNFQSYKDIFSKILESTLIQVILDENNKWKLITIAPQVSEDFDVSSDELMVSSLDFTVDYNDTSSDILIAYNLKEESINISNPLADRSSSVTATSSVARYVHKIERSKGVESIYITEEGAQWFADHLSYALGDRLGTFGFKTKNKYFEMTIGDVVQISRAPMPGFTYDIDTNRVRLATIIRSDLSKKDLSFDALDYKGIDDNSGVW